MEIFKYYKRGVGELDTSNFDEIINSGEMEVDRIDDKTFFSLLTLNTYLETEWFGNDVTVTVRGYVANLRGDKDLFPPAVIYQLLTRLKIVCKSIQHESTDKIRTTTITKNTILTDLPKASQWFTAFVGADGSVPKFYPTIDSFATKVREGGKVVSLDYKMPSAHDIRSVVIVDDILGGGATIQMLLDTIKSQGFTGTFHLWVAYNEGIHKPEFLEQFESHFIGNLI